MQLTTTVRNARLQALVTAAGSGCTLKAYTGTSPGVGSAVTGTLLSTLTVLVWGTVTAGAVTATATADSSAAAAGTPGYVRLATSGGAAVADFPAAVGSGEANFSAGVSLAGTDTLTSFTITEGNA